ncbi:MAG: desulfoferrodoxin FeS4 iron-binding domain-containing protein [Acidobacteria bacterium]|nr:desulfoferrodoxin FeS4 iron-binding domain-containing protein [Acidobacteriota bacterium]
MSSAGEKYQCTKCGNTVEVKTGGSGTLACCGVPMQKI